MRKQLTREQRAITMSNRFVVRGVPEAGARAGQSVVHGLVRGIGGGGCAKMMGELAELVSRRSASRRQGSTKGRPLTRAGEAVARRPLSFYDAVGKRLAGSGRRT